MVGHSASSFGTKANLPDRLFTRNVEHLGTRFGGVGGHLEQQRRLADTGFTREQNHGAGNDATTENTVKLTNASGARCHGYGRDIRDGFSGRRGNDGGRFDRLDGA